MCKQEDYFKKLIYMHNKKIYIYIFHVMQAQGGPSRAELWDRGTTEQSGFTSLTEKFCSNQQSASDAKQNKKKLSRCGLY